MNYYLKGYYGYKNFGDELLLLWLLPWLFARYTIEKLYIECDDVVRLENRLQRHDDLVGNLLEKIEVVPKKNTIFLQQNIKIFGGGEVFTDARPFPYNGRNYLLWFFWTILKKKFHVVGGIGTIKKKSTKLLYRFLLGRARSITVRDATSGTVAKYFSTRVHLYHDFALDVLEKLKPTISSTDRAPYHIINVNPYIRNEQTKEHIRNLSEKYPHDEFRYIPGEMESDQLYVSEIRAIIPTLQLYDRTTYHIHDSVSFLAWAGESIAARLHVLICLHEFSVPYVPLVYQEKISKLLGV